MKKEIVERIKAQMLNKAVRSNQYQDLVEAGFAGVLEEAKGVIRGEQGTMTQEETLRGLYFKMVEEYSSKKKFVIPKVRTEKSRATWRRIEAARVRSGQDSDTYLHAQFAFFHQAFGKPPTIVQLGTAKAVTRAQEFVGTTKHKVKGIPDYKMELCDLLKSSDQRMRALCKAQEMTRQEVYERLVKTGLVFFPKEYTSIDPAYQEVMGS